MSFNSYYPDDIDGEDAFEARDLPEDARIELRVLSDVEVAFPANVCPVDAPDRYYRKAQPNPWVELASALFFGDADATELVLVPRQAENAADAWKWACAALGDYGPSYQQKMTGVAWILESFFWAYFFNSNPPDWQVKHLAASKVSKKEVEGGSIISTKPSDTATGVEEST